MSLLPKNKAIHQFFSSFGIDAYRDTSVPDDAVLPYLTYQYVTAGFNQPCSMTVRMWFYGESESIPDEYAEAFNRALANGGAKVLFDGGSVVFTRGTPFCIAQSGESDKNIKLRYFNVTANFDCEV